MDIYTTEKYVIDLPKGLNQEQLNRIAEIVKEAWKQGFRYGHKMLELEIESFDHEIIRGENSV